MKCNKCNAEWQVDASRSASITVCPFCQEKLTTEKSSDWKYFDNTKELLKYVVAEYGNDALFGRKYFSDHTSPMMPQGQKNLVKQAFDCGAVKILQDNMTADQHNKKIAVKQAVGKLIDTYSSAREAAERVVWEFTNAIGWGMLEPQGGDTTQGDTGNGHNPPPPPPPPPERITSFMKRAWLFLEDSEWKRAYDYFNNVLDIDAEYASAYVGLLCVDLKLTRQDKLADIANPDTIIDNSNYKKAIRFADTVIKIQLDDYIQTIYARIDAEQKAAAEAERKRIAAEEAVRRKRVQDAFDNAVKIMNNAIDSEDYRKAITAFESINSNYQDINSHIKSKISVCERKSTAAEEAARRKRVQYAYDYVCDIIMRSAQSPDQYRQAIEAFDSIDSNYQDINNQIKSKIAECERKITAAEKTAAHKKHVQDTFDIACKNMKKAKSFDEYRQAITVFNDTDSSFQDINSQIKSKIVECERERKRKRKRNVVLATVLTVFLLGIIAIWCAFYLSIPSPQLEISTIPSPQSENSIITIRGVEYSTELTKLYFSNLELTSSDIEPLRYMTNLTLLYLHDNQIDDISALQGLTNLTKLALNGNQISDISALEGLINLTGLSLHENQISDTSALKGLTNLTELNLRNNQISDINTLQGLTNLRGLYLQNNQINDISALQNFANLTTLGLGANQISDISALQGLENLRTLALWGNKIGDISMLQGLTNLRKLYLQNNQINDISALQGLANLTELNLRYNQIGDISALQALTNLTELNLQHNSLTQVQVDELRVALPLCAVDGQNDQ